MRSRQEYDSQKIKELLFQILNTHEELIDYTYTNCSRLVDRTNHILDSYKYVCEIIIEEVLSTTDVNIEV